MNEIQILTLIQNFPVGEIAKSREELLCKTEIISYLARFEEQFDVIENSDERENSVKKFCADILCLGTDERIPELAEATRKLQLSAGFVQDYGKIQDIKEHNSGFNATFNALAVGMNLQKNSKDKSYN